jgi:hypothetical protein
MLMVKMFWIYIVEERMDLSGTIPKMFIMLEHFYIILHSISLGWKKQKRYK